MLLRKSLASFACLFGLCAASKAASGLDAVSQLQVVVVAKKTDFAFLRLDSGVQFRVGEQVKNVIFYGPEIVRVNTNLGATHTTQPSLAVIAKPAALSFDLREDADTVTLLTGRLHVVADKKTGSLAFYHADGTLIVRERSERPVAVKPVTISGAPSYEATQAFTLSSDESLYGLGQYNDPYMDYRGKEVLLVQTNIGTVVPMLVSTRRYGILWDITSKMIFKDGTDGATLWAESAPAGMDYYFAAGRSMDDVIAGYRLLTGSAPMIPKQALGLFMSKERYKTQDQVLEVVRNFRKAGFPLDYIVQDWQYWGGADGTWSGMTWDKQRFPDPAGFTKTLHDELHVKLMNSIWPTVGNDTALAHELDAKGLRFAPLHWISKQARVYDAYSAEGRAIYFKYIKQGLLDVGVDALWMDGTEVEVGGACHDPAQVEADIKGLGRNAMGDFTRYLNPYSLLTTKGTYEGQRATSDKRVFTLTRSAWAGQQRYGALPWSGDTTSSWATLRAQISGGINIAMAGLPYWTQDTGGFFVHHPEGEKNPSYRELFARWNQFAIFNPIYRIHGTDIEREPYLFKTLDPEIYQSLLEAAQLRYRLLPYLYSLAWKSTSEGYTMMRGLPMDFPDQPALRRIDDVYMFGPAFLVHPITRAMYHPEVPPPAVIGPDYLRTQEGQPGLAVEYYAGTAFERFASKTVDAKVDHDWPSPPLANPPAGLSDINNFSARWTGSLIAPETGEYEIGIEGDDGFRLWLDDKLIVEDWINNSARYKGSKINFTQDQVVRVRIDYFQGTGNRSIRFGWRRPSDIRELANSKPVVDNTQTTLLAQGADWYDFWTNERLAGGQTVKRSYPINLFPLYVRAGSIVPMGPVLQYATERSDAPIEIRIYPGANSSFTLYEDDNETYAYEKGQRAICELQWNDAAKALHLGTRQGSFPGMLETRQITVTLVSAGESAKSTSTTAQSRTIAYAGAPLEVRFGD